MERLRTLRLALICASVELVVGLAAYARPSAFSSPLYDVARPYLAGFAALSLVAGTLLLLWVQGDLPVFVRPVAFVVAAAPVGVLASLGAASADYVSALTYGALAVALLVASAMRREVRPAPDLFALTLGGAEAVMGLLMLTAPSLFASPVYEPVRPFLWAVGLAALLSATALLAPARRRPLADPRGAVRAVGSLVLPALMAGLYWQSGAWTGVIVWSLSAPAFLFHREALLLRTTGEHAGGAWQRGYRTRLSIWSWLITLIAVLMTTFAAGSISSPLRVAVFAVGLSACNLAGAWLLPRFVAPDHVVLFYLGALTVGVGVLFAGTHSGAEALLALLVIFPSVAARAQGRRAGFRLLWLSVGIVVASPVLHWLFGSADTWLAVWRSVLDLMILLAANGLGLTSTVRQSQLVKDLAEKQGRLQYQNEVLTEVLHRVSEMKGLAERLSAVVEATPDYVIISDLDGHRLYVNESARKLLAVDPEQPAEAIAVEETYPEWVRRKMLDVALPQALESGLWRGESALLDAAGREVPVLQVILAHKDDSGSISYISTVSRDITEFKQAEAALRESEERFRGAFDHASTGMALIDLNGVPLQANRALQAMLGYSEQELRGQNLRALTHPDDLGEESTLVHQLMGGKIPYYHMEKRYLNKEGQIVWGLVSASLVQDRDGRAHYIISQVQDITERKRAETQMLHLANYDMLTELFNRQRFQEELDRELAGAERHGRKGAVLFLDLDQFKYVNDSLGHAVGDEVLKGVALALKSRLRRSDVIARLGGDEFAVLLEEIDGPGALAVARELLREVREHKLLVLGRDLNVTISIGVALYPDQGVTTGELLARADMAMYQAKELGRDACALYSPTDSAPARLGEKLTWERRIRWALSEDRFVLYAQPIVELSSGEVETHELLLRMIGEDGQTIPPGAFLTIAEQFGLIREIDRWVVQRAIRMLAEAATVGRDVRFSVNLSGKAFGDRELLPYIRQLLTETGVNAARLMFELTETAAVGDPTMVVEFVQSLRQLGCKFALDDFGAGFSWFDYLKRLPVDVMKIDGSFVRHLDKDNIDRHLVRAMVDAARGLGIQTVAECVESEEPVELLRSYGVEYVQGFHVGRPVPIEQLVTAL